ncbi:DUF697 domain-containing protein [Herbaspirillum lusitanum]|uniref:YcjF family protein n=1 Tax=Herbaspirillum lusitanum TaxID=213312 RepID=UPI0022371560|nr:DUF697 domain-containing protein [Herbaspirillum lusitanum]MCW5298885.1 DUF697 domain-containing protein [Herbaspirillum lusitanum]
MKTTDQAEETITAEAPAAEHANEQATEQAAKLTPAEVENEALHSIKNHAMTAMGVGILPIPGLDLIALTGVQLSLLRKIGNLYGFTLSDETGKKLLGAVLSGYLPLLIAGPVSSVLKFIPGVGIAAGVLAQSTLAGATTYAVGKLFLQHFASGGTLLDVDTKEMGKKLKQHVQEGKDFLKKHAPGAKKDAI